MTDTSHQENDNLYSPPNTINPTQESLCPKCGQLMQTGALRSRAGIRWQDRKNKKLLNILLGGKSMGSKKPGYHCPKCRLFILDA